MRGHGESHRPERVASVIMRSVAVIVESEISDPRVHGVSVVDCEMSRDLKNATVYVDIEDDDASVLAALNNCASYVRRQLAVQNLELRAVPQIRFVMDRSRSYYEHIEKVIKDIHSGEDNA